MPQTKLAQRQLDFANPTFTGLLTTPALRLNNVAVLINNSAPATRSDGSALVNGDLWWNPNTRILGNWNGIYWLSPIERYAAGWLAAISATTTTVTTLQIPPTNITSGISSNYQSLFIHAAGFVFSQSALNWDSTNYWSYVIRAIQDDTAVATQFATGTMNTNAPDTNAYTRIYYTDTVLAYNTVSMSCQFTKSNNPSNISRGALFVALSRVLS